MNIVTILFNSFCVIFPLQSINIAANQSERHGSGIGEIPLNFAIEN